MESNPYVNPRILEEARQLDILEKGEINTYREEEHDLLMAIRNGNYQKEDGTYDEDDINNILKKLCSIKTVVICCSFVLIYMLLRNLYPLFYVLY